jgi:hypothetical protein
MAQQTSECFKTALTEFLEYSYTNARMHIREGTNVFYSVTSYKTIILLVVLYGCETWSLTVRDEHKLRVFENRVLRRIFGPKRDGVTGGWRELHNEELHNLYSSPSIIRIIKSRRMR